MNFLKLIIAIFIVNGAFSQSFGTSVPMSFNIKSTVQPPVLDYAEQPVFSDEDGNGAINANEKCKISFKLSNNGNADALNLRAVLTPNNFANELIFNPKTLLPKVEKAGGTRAFEIPIIGGVGLPDGTVEFTLEITEPFGFGINKLKIVINTRKLANPEVKVVDYVISSNDENSTTLELKKPFTMLLKLQNIGQGIAKNVEAKLILPKDVFALSGETNYKFESMIPGETKDIQCDLIINGNYVGTILPLKLEVTESYKKFGKNWNQNLTLKQQLSSQSIVVASTKEDKTKIEQASFKSDVDMNIPANTQTSENKFALIIGNEDYTTYQSGLTTEMNVMFANADATAFRNYCTRTLGVPEKNVVFVLDATAGKMNKALNQFSELLSVSNGKAIAYVFYAGHGLPDEKTKESYIIPVDVSGSDLSGAVKLSSFYSKLTEHPSTQINVFIDACFSGGGRESGLMAYTRGVKVAPSEEFLTGNICIFSATTGEESSLPWKEKQHGLFTYYLLKKIQETKGDVTLATLYEYVRDKVVLESVRTNSKKQTPLLRFPSELEPKIPTIKLF